MFGNGCDRTKQSRPFDVSPSRLRLHTVVTPRWGRSFRRPNGSDLWFLVPSPGMTELHLHQHIKHRSRVVIDRPSISYWSTILQRQWLPLQDSDRSGCRLETSRTDRHTSAPGVMTSRRAPPGPPPGRRQKDSREEPIKAGSHAQRHLVPCFDGGC